ncbi:MAG: hypothetical protein ACHQHN_18375 [Sphingobacteriales bacterium]
MLLLSLMSASIAQQVSFSGNWTLNEQISAFGKVPPFIIFHSSLIGQKDDQLTITSVNRDAQGNTVPVKSLNYDLTGIPTERFFQDTIKLVSSMKWSPGHQTLLKMQSYTPVTRPDQPLKRIKETWSLSPDGKELIIERSFESLNNREISYVIRAVYDNS